MRFDLHVHTDISPCSVLRIEEILQHARLRGLDGVCITDHASIEVKNRAREGMQEDGLCLIFGMEYTTADGDFLLFGPVEKLPLGLDANELLSRFASLGGVAVAAHPFRAERPTSEFLVKSGLCTIIEGINGRNRELDNLRARVWQDRYGVRLVGGSDAHSLAELGRVATRLETRVSNREEFVKALAGDLFSLECCDNDLRSAASRT